VVDLTAQPARTERLLRQLLQAKTGRKSEQLWREQLALFAAEAGLVMAEPETVEQDEEDGDDPPSGATGESRPRGRKPLPRHLKRERIEHDLPEAEKHCAQCDQDLRQIGEEISEHYEYIPAQMKVIEDACFTYACACTVKTAAKPLQPIEKSTAGASVLAQVIVAKYADHLPLHRQVKMFRRFGVELADQTLCGAMRRATGAAVSKAEAVRAGVQSGGHRRYASEGAGPETAASAQRAHLAICGRPRACGGGVRLHADQGAGRKRF